MSKQKEKFFAQYWGQPIMRKDTFDFINVRFSIDSQISGYHLELTPLSQISDEDNNYKGTYSKRSQKHLWSVEQADYLRSKGYALPWMGISVEEQIKRGWVKLKT